MKLLDGREPAAFIKLRHDSVVAGLPARPCLAIVRMGDDDSTSRYLAGKVAYGTDIGAQVDVYAESAATLLEQIHRLGADPGVTGIIIQLPLPGATPELTAAALAAVPLTKDVDGLAPGTSFEAATPKAILWLLAAYALDIKGQVAVIGQGRLVGRPLADRLEASGHEVARCDIHTADLGAVTRDSRFIITATGQSHLLTPNMVKEGTTIVDAGSPARELDPRLYQLDVNITPNPGGVGPMTVASLFDNLLIAAQRAL